MFLTLEWGRGGGLGASGYTQSKNKGDIGPVEGGGEMWEESFGS